MAFQRGIVLIDSMGKLEMYSTDLIFCTGWAKTPYLFKNLLCEGYLRYWTESNVVDSPKGEVCCDV